MRVESRADVRAYSGPPHRASSRTMDLAAELARYAFGAGRGPTHVARGMGLAPAASPSTGAASPIALVTLWRQLPRIAA